MKVIRFSYIYTQYFVLILDHNIKSFDSNKDANKLVYHMQNDHLRTDILTLIRI